MSSINHTSYLTTQKPALWVCGFGFIGTLEVAIELHRSPLASSPKAGFSAPWFGISQVAEKPAPQKRRADSEVASDAPLSCFRVIAAIESQKPAPRKRDESRLLAFQ